MYMYKILLLDSDWKSVDEITGVLENNVPNVEIKGSVVSGREGIEIIRQEQPDIIITEVRLLGMNGIEMIKRAMDFMPDVHCIIVSAYEYFDFVMQALELHIEAYILKPLNYRKFLEHIENVLAKIRKREEEKEKKKKLIQNYNRMRNYVESSFIYDSLLNVCGSEERENYKKLLSFDHYGYIMDIEFGPLPSLKAEEHWILMEDPHKLSIYFHQFLDELGHCAIGPKIDKRILAYISVKNPKANIDERKRKIFKAASSLINNLKGKMYSKVRIGVGSIYPISELHSSYEEALRCLRYNIKGDVIFNDQVKKEKILTSDEFKEYESRMLEYINLGKNEALDIFIQLLEALRPLDEKNRKNKIMELLILIYRSTGWGQKESGGIPIDYIQYYEEIKNISPEELEPWAYKKFHYIIMKAVNMGELLKIPIEVRAALEYMTENYNEELSLEEVAGHVGLSPQYFSKLFKECVGCNFIDWIAGQRIAKAKELFHKTSLNIKDVCFQVGYNDPNYFSRIFKKVTGLTPTQYIHQNSDNSTNNKN